MKRYLAILGSVISIHALLAESDRSASIWLERWSTFLSTLSLRRATGDCFALVDILPISIHALLAESDRHGVRVAKIDFAFLSTLSLRRATSRGSVSIPRYRNFYPRSPCGERPAVPQQENGQAATISIHALLAESDYMGVTVLGIQHNFYPRSPCGERQSLFTSVVSSTDFYPRSPCGERQPKIHQWPDGLHHFYPRSPCGERPHPIGIPVRVVEISIHALLAESDCQL